MEVDTVPDGVLSRRFLPWARVVWVLTVIAALVTGFIGFEQFLHGLPPGRYGTSFLDILYYDLQLFVLSSNPLFEPSPYPPLLQIARFAAPVATFYAVVEAGHSLFAARYRQWRIRRRTGNVIVVGTTATAEALAVRLAAGNRRVVPVATGNEAALRSAGAARAEVLYAFGDDREDSSLNLAIAASAADLGTRRVYAQVSDPRLALALRARRLGLPDDDDRHVDVVHLDEVAARALVRRDGPDIAAGAPPTVLIAGTGSFGRALIIELARYWRLNAPDGYERLPVTLVGDSADAVARQLREQWPVVAAVCELDSAPGLESLAGRSPHRLYVCEDDEDGALLTALTATQLWHGPPQSLVLRLNRLARYRTVFPDGPGHLLDDLGQRLRLVGLADLASDPDLIAEDLVERLAQAIHDRYLLKQLGDGVVEGSMAFRQWPDLDRGLRQANRQQARDIGRKLRLVGCTVAPAAAHDEPFAFAEAEVEVLARLEHERWHAERLSEGWQYGRRDDLTKHHPHLIPWDEIPESARGNNRQSVRDLPVVLADAGLRIIRFRRLSE
jgi:hypothetical protein